MKRSFVSSKKAIPKRANAKIVDMNGRYFLIGGMTTQKNTCDIYEFRLIKNEQNEQITFQVEWRPLKFQNHIFTPRNSFAACASKTCIYIWGGLQTNQQNMTQKCLSDLIEIDIQKGSMKLFPLKEKYPIHSACLSYDEKTHSLIAFGGTNQTSTLEAYLYTLSLHPKQQSDSSSEQLQWKRTIVKNATQQGYLWQHSANLLNSSILNQQKQQQNESSKYIVLVGGCKLPQSPYKTITQLKLQSNNENNQKTTITNTIQIQESVVAHQSVYDEKNKCLYIVGGANGGGFNRFLYIVKQGGKVEKIDGHNAVGASSVLTTQGLVVYGGVCGPEMLNDMIVYHS